MTAPLTPHDEPFPPYPGGGTAPGEAEGGREGFTRELRRGALVAVLVAVGGIALGLLWAWLSPRIPLISDGHDIFLKDTEGEEAIGADGTFVLISAGLGIISALLVFWRCRTGGVAVVIGLAAGSALAAVIGWRLGVQLGPGGDIVAHAKKVGPNVVFDAPLKLRAGTALIAWPAAAMLVHLCVTSLLGPKEPGPAAPPPPGTPGTPGTPPQWYKS